jgi:two-component system LytT family response regulator
MTGSAIPRTAHNRAAVAIQKPVRATKNLNAAVRGGAAAELAIARADPDGRVRRLEGIEDEGADFQDEIHRRYALRDFCGESKPRDGSRVGEDVRKMQTEAAKPRTEHAAIRTIVVDDEPLARDWIREHLRADEGVDLVAECEDGFKAVQAIDRLRPDLVLLDVQMPGLDGFEVLGMLENPPPAVVFVTAFDQYALRAFDVHAIDYLLKPVSPERLRKAIERTRERLEKSMTEDTAAELLGLLRDVRRYPEWFLVKAGGRSHFVRVKDIDWIESRRNDVVFHVGTATHVYHDTTSGIEGRLDPARFLRIHRSTIVAIDRIRELHPWFNGDYEVVLKDGTKLAMSAGHKQKLKAFRRGLI